MFKKASKSVCTCAVPPHPVPATPSTFSAMKASENTEQDSDDPKSADGRDTQTEYTSTWLYSLCIEQIKNYLNELR
jgi:hypothetical protein